MKIGPANNAASLIGENQEAAKKTNREVEKEKPREDHLDISSRAREMLAKQKATSQVSGEYENNHETRLDKIRLKISTGYYEKAKIKIDIAAKLSDDKAILREYYKSIY